ncbi:hypothetical protein B6I21_06020 [candidate division KSB1 bacterium 4572_119]|nr:MAG: hypothetical protein B6I21_06020 [candidate division KSB1 bacterium 4572_119]
MKTHEFFVILGIFTILFTVAIFIFATTALFNQDEETVSNLMGSNVESDSTLSAEDSIIQFQESEREDKLIFLWIGIPLGLAFILGGFLIKRIKEGPDAFIDYDDDE